MKKIVPAALAFSLISGCASIISDSTYPVTINSSPAEDDFTITNSNGIKIHSGRTPSTVMLKSGDGYFSPASYTVTFRKGRFAEKTITIDGKMDGWYIGNLIFGGLLGVLVIDPATGAMWKLPEEVSASLVPIK